MSTHVVYVGENLKAMATILGRLKAKVFVVMSVIYLL